MTTVALRFYIKEIENLIEQDEIDQAVAHCKHILKHFPKHLDTYRLLGKGYLENQRLGDAADIFQRVLSSVPDDFIAHVGMSIIREDESNLDAAIWHMERAFDVQPSNSAIQDELRRLYGKRDGLEPPKIRLTRSALARMYAHGDLHTQAIAELQVALSETPDRLDLQVLLAEMYYQNGQLVEAAEKASQLIVNLPYCFTANSILLNVLETTDRRDEADENKVRLRDLDPYMAFVSPNVPTPDLVVEDKVSLPKLEWDPLNMGAQGGGIHQPEWASSLGLDVEGIEIPELKAENDELPAWFGQTSKTETSPMAFDLTDTGETEDNLFDDEFELERSSEKQTSNLPQEADSVTSEENTMSDDNIPDWMKDVGWSSSDDEDEGNGSSFDVDPKSVDDEIEKAELPDWLQSMAPEGKEEPDPSDIGEESSSDGPPSWLSEIGGEETHAVDIPQKGSESTEPQVDKSGDDVPDWLRDLNVDQPSGSDESTDTDLPNWLADLSDETPPSEPDPTEDAPEWLKEITSDMPVVSPPNPNDIENAPDWLKEITGEFPKRQVDEPKLNVGGEESKPDEPDWLADLTGEMPASETAASQTEGELPDWLDDLEDETILGDISSDIPSMEEIIDDAPLRKQTGELTDWLAENVEEVEDLSEIEDLPEAPKVEEEDVPDWLAELADAAPSIESTEIEDLVSEDQTEGWLDEMLVEPVQDIQEEEDLPNWLRSPVGSKQVDPEIQIEAEEVEDLSEVPSWLEDIATGAGVAAGAATLADEGSKADETHEDEPSQEMPDWLAVGSTADELEATSSDEITSDEIDIPDWLEGIENDLEEEVDSEVEDEGAIGLEDELAALPHDEIPAWAVDEDVPEDIEDTKPVKKHEVEPEVMDGIDTPEDALAWLDSLAEEGFSDEDLSMDEISSEPAKLEAVPLPVSDEIEVEEVADISQMEEEDAMAWLEGLADQQGELEDGLASDIKDEPEDGWLKDITDLEVEKDVEEELEVMEETTPEMVGEVLEDESETIVDEEDAVEEDVVEDDVVDEDVVEEDAFAWLESLADAGEVDLEESLMEDVGEVKEVKIETVMEEEMPQVETASEDGIGTEEEPIDEEDVPMVDESEALSWLENLADSDEEGELDITDESEGQPEWLKALIIESPDIDLPLEEDVVEEAAIPDWLNASEEMEGEVSFDDDKDDLVLEPEAPVWVPEEELQSVSKAEIEEVTPETEMEEVPLQEVEAGELDEPAEEEVVVPSVDLDTARTALAEGSVGTSVEQYKNLIADRQNLSEIIDDLSEALEYRHPVNVEIWQTLGDAHMASDRLQDALDAYTKAEELLR